MRRTGNPNSPITVKLVIILADYYACVIKLKPYKAKKTIYFWVFNGVILFMLHVMNSNTVLTRNAGLGFTQQKYVCFLTFLKFQRLFHE